MAAKRFLITSGAGGVGKSSVASRLGASLARRGARVLVCDLSTTSRSLDMFFSLAERGIYDFSDLLAQKVSPSRALLSVEGVHAGIPKKRVHASGELFFLPGVYRTARPATVPELRRTFATLEEEMALDFLLVDSPFDEGGLRAAAVTDATLLVSTLAAPSLRATEEAALRLPESVSISLVLNAFPLIPGEEPRDIPPLPSLLDSLHLPLAGVIPAEYAVMREDGAGQAARPGKTNAHIAYENIAARLGGDPLPLFSGFRGIRRRKYLKQLL